MVLVLYIIVPVSYTDISKESKRLNMDIENAFRSRD
jgi:hypothetical protein